MNRFILFWNKFRVKNDHYFLQSQVETFLNGIIKLHKHIKFQIKLHSTAFQTLNSISNNEINVFHGFLLKIPILCENVRGRNVYILYRLSLLHKIRIYDKKRCRMWTLTYKAALSNERVICFQIYSYIICLEYNLCQNLAAKEIKILDT